MAGPTYTERLVLPSRLVPPRPLHLSEAEDDFLLITQGLDDLTALLEGIITPFVNPMTGVGDLIVGGTAGAPVRVAPGQLGQHFIMGEDGPEWVDAPTPLPAFTLPTDLGKTLGVTAEGPEWVDAGAASLIPSPVGHNASMPVTTDLVGTVEWVSISSIIPVAPPEYAGGEEIL